jgi:hypothetical protein
MDLNEIDLKDVEWIDLAEDSDSFERSNGLSSCVKCGEFLDYLMNCQLSRRTVLGGNTKLPIISTKRKCTVPS